MVSSSSKINVIKTFLFDISTDLSSNLLSGVVLDCWKLFSISVLNFTGNNLFGGIPSTFGALLESLHLSNNSLSGELSSSLERCTDLIILDLGNNKFTVEFLLG